MYYKKTGYIPFITELSGDKRKTGFNFSPKLLLLFIFALSSVVTVTNISGAITDLVFSFFGKGIQMPLPGGRGDVVYMFFKSVLIAALFEEMLFRGALIHSLSGRKNITKILFSALLFSLMHYNLYQLFYSFAAGFVIAFFAVYTGSLTFAFLLHFSSNFVTLIFSVLSAKLSTESYKITASITLAIFLLISLVFLALIIFKKVKKQPIFEECGNTCFGNKIDENNSYQNQSFEKKPIAYEIYVYIILSALLSLMNAF
jgi:membrane protease YdiL (CAAX protease family)